MTSLKEAILDFTDKKSVNGFSKFNAECRNNKLANHLLNINVPINTENGLKDYVQKNFVSAQQYYNPILDRVHKISNAHLDVEVPILYPTAEWKAEGAPSNDATKKLKRLKPKRIVGQMTISKSFLHYHPEDDTEFINSMMEIVYDTLLSQMFSSNEESEDAPKGLLNTTYYTTTYNVTKDDDGVEVVNEVVEEHNNTITINSANDLAVLMSATKCGGNGVFVLSPSAEQKLLASNPNLYDNGKIFNREVIVVSQMESDYVAYLDLSKIVLVDWNIIGVDIDPVSLAHLNQVKLTTNYYCNFEYLREDTIAVGKMG